MGWRLRGSYFEACNCDPICPCRRIDEVPGGRSTHGYCEGVLSWLIEQGDADRLDLSGLAVALAFRYDDDEPRSPWTWLLYLDDQAAPEQQSALREIFSGRRGGDAATQFPWARKPSTLIGVRAAGFDVSHRHRRQWLRVREEVSVSIRDRYAAEQAVACVIPGYDQPGEELVADSIVVDHELLEFSHAGTCGYAARFDYVG